MQNMKNLPYPNTTTSMVNDFVLNTFEHHSALLDIFDFSYGLLVGMYERIVDEDSVSEISLNSMKVVRRHNEKDGYGPLFRRWFYINLYQFKLQNFKRILISTQKYFKNNIKH